MAMTIAYNFRLKSSEEKVFDKYPSSLFVAKRVSLPSDLSSKKENNIRQEGKSPLPALQQLMLLFHFIVYQGRYLANDTAA